MEHFEENSYSHRAFVLKISKMYGQVALQNVTFSVHKEPLHVICKE